MTDPTTEPKPQGDPDSLGDGGQKALKAERARADKAERDLRALQAQYDTAAGRITELEQTAQALTGDIAARDLTISRLNVGIDKQLPKAFIARLRGDDETALAADADELLTLIPAPAPPAGPRPDPTQGPRAPSPASAEQEFAATVGPLFN